ncbi:hypothetical protein [Streptococcus loxodontisalivarius]|uniref:ABC-type transport system involved in multi-copper enzyme maturation permease subunit n=1 Tax=Streptococcus loxodontisalivarius TaxID=1349415 RepID=A0ABS2PPG9_9STRE|nr:hypothetical protein [Streptococcus loxodontisalivarius]MBM7641927.1 ABC-type transport system involved in multi-copper enzyme maturation permease subunit [Streptococcus loxodontisalivarius]
MIKYDFFHWVRSRKIFFLFFIIIICTLVATFGTYYAKDIIDTLGTTGAKVIVQEMHWRDIASSYFKSTSQICLFAAIYLTSTECQLGKVESEKLFYQTRISRGGKVLLSKVFTGFLINFGSVFLGGLLTIYIVRAFYSTINLKEFLLAIAIQSLSFCLFTIFGNAISLYLTPFISAMILEIFILFSSLIENLNYFGQWSPFILLTPNNFLSNFEIRDYSEKFLSLLIMTIVSLILIWFKPVKQSR